MATPAGQTSVFAALPIHIPEAITVTAMGGGSLPWGAPSVSVILGHSNVSPGEPILGIGSDWPMPWIRTGVDLTQEEQEALHVRRFRTDHIIASGAAPFVGVFQGTDPPDVFVETESGRVGLECMTLSVSERRGAHALFRNIRRLVAMNPDMFCALAGHVVHMWFNDEDSALCRPHAQTDEAAALMIARALAEYRPNDALVVRQGVGMPAKMPELPLSKTDAGASFYSTPMIGAAPDTPLFSLAGFELSMAYTTTHTAHAEWEALKKKIKRKDKPGNDWLLISSSAVDQRGCIYPSEDILADFLLSNFEEFGPLEHIRRITVHMWSSGRAVDIWPEVKPIFGPIYAGSSPWHLPFQVPVEQQD